MAAINFDGLQPVTPIHPRVMVTHGRVSAFQENVMASTGAERDRKAVHARVEGWLYDLKYLVLIADGYRRAHDFYNRVYNPFEDSEGCPADATEDQRFQYEHNLVVAALRFQLDNMHTYTSVLLDKVARFFPVYFGPTKAVKTDNHGKFWARVKHRKDITYLPASLKTDADWLQDHVDWFRNQAIIHTAGFDERGLHMRGLKNKLHENVRTFARGRVDQKGKLKDVDETSATMEEIIEHLCRYLDGVIDVLEQRFGESVLADPTRPRPERI